MQTTVQLGICFAQAGQALERGDLEAARRGYLRCLELAPQSVSVLNNLAGVLILQQDYSSARTALYRVIDLDGTQAEPWINLGLIEEEHSGDLLQALACFERAVELAPSRPESHFNRANVLARLNRLEAAAQAYRLAIRAAPRYASAYHNLGNVLRELRQPEQALSAFDAAVKLDPKADVYCNRGYALRDLGNLAAALKSFEKALRLDPNTESCAGILLRTKADLCDWRGWDAALAHLRALIDAGELAAPPHCILSLFDDADLQGRAARIWLAKKHPAPSGLEQPPASADGVAPVDVARQRIRIGYFSADLRHHPVAELLIGLIEHHDKTRFELFAFDYGPASSDALRARLRQAFDCFIDIAALSDVEAAALARQHRIDIALDLGGLTAFSRPGIFMQRAAPVQVGYLGYPGTMPADGFDYLLADLVLVPPCSASKYSEKLACLPHFFANDFAHRTSQSVATRATYGLPEQAFVFACFSNTWKFDPATFACWMAILKRVPSSVLFLISNDAQATANLRASAKALGVDAHRLVLGARVSETDYLPRYRLADLFLDTYPHAAASMAVDALWMGLPLVTMTGESFASRLAASALHGVGLASLVTTSREQYQDLAVALAQAPERLQAMRASLEAARHTAPLFDTARYANHVEELYGAMLHRARHGLEPSAVTVVPPRATV